MLKVPAPFPQVGSFALLVDGTQPFPQRAELVRIQRRRLIRDSLESELREEVAVAFPLRTGASGNRMVAEADLIDATPLTKEEERELADLQRNLRGVSGKTPKQKAGLARVEALRSRAIHSIVMQSELAKLRSIEARQQPSIGSLVRNAA